MLSSVAFSAFAQNRDVGDLLTRISDADPIIKSNTAVQVAEDAADALLKAGAEMGAATAMGGDPAAAAGFLQTISNQLETLYQGAQQLDEIINGNEMAKQMYSASRLLTTSSEFYNLYSAYDQYNMTLGLVKDELKSYSTTPSDEWDYNRWYRTARLATDSAAMVAEDFENILNVVTSMYGMTHKERIDMIKAKTKEILAQKGILLQEVSELRDAANRAKSKKALAEANEAYNNAFCRYSKSKRLKTSYSAGSAGQYIYLSPEQESEANAIVNAAKKYKEKKEKYTMEEIENKKSYLVERAINITTIITGLLLLFALPLAFARRHRGERQTADAMFKWMIAIVFFIIALQVVKIIIR